MAIATERYSDSMMVPHGLVPSAERIRMMEINGTDRRSIVVVAGKSL